MKQDEKKSAMLESTQNTSGLEPSGPNVRVGALPKQKLECSGRSSAVMVGGSERIAGVFWVPMHFSPRPAACCAPIFLRRHH